MRKSGVPIPAYVPPPVREFMERKREAENPQYGLTHLAKAAGKSLNGTVVFFKDDQHVPLFTFEKFCQGLGRTMDEVAPFLLLPEQERRQALQSLICERYKDANAYATEAGVSSSYIYRLFDGTGGQKISQTYALYAGALGVTLEELATILGDSK